jgi:hypothetical protein
VRVDEMQFFKTEAEDVVVLVAPGVVSALAILSV